MAGLRSRVSLFVLFALLLAFSTLWQARAEYGGSASTGGRPAQAIDIDDPQGCPGERGQTRITGESRGAENPTAVVNGEQMGGRWFAAGSRSYWHCHPGGQFMMVMEGRGRVQRRGQRMRDLSVGESEHAGPWVEHWHGAAFDSDVRYIQLSFQPTGTRWMEEVSQDDYLGNDIGMTTRQAR